MNNLSSIQDILRLLGNLIRSGVIVETDLNAGRCRVQTGGIVTDWLQWLTHRAGRSRRWWAPYVGEQVLILAVGGELDTAFVLLAIFSDDHLAPPASADAFHMAGEVDNVFAMVTIYASKAQAMRAAQAKWGGCCRVLYHAGDRVRRYLPGNAGKGIRL
ncbi:TPA: phage baseplate assembly protein V [Citrobacter amalonaticus]|nr:phage baseplate assembly protein V [Citrobacter amalonaticus]